MSGLKLTEFEDIELLHVVVGVYDSEGWASTADIAADLKLDTEFPNRSVGSRMSWLRRYGVVEREEKGDRWRINEVGKSLMGGKLTKAQEDAFRELSNGKSLVGARRLSQILQASGPEAAILMNRQWRYGLAQRRG